MSSARNPWSKMLDSDFPREGSQLQTLALGFSCLLWEEVPGNRKKCLLQGRNSTGSQGHRDVLLL